MKANKSLAKFTIKKISVNVQVIVCKHSRTQNLLALWNTLSLQLLLLMWNITSAGCRHHDSPNLVQNDKLPEGI